MKTQEEIRAIAVDDARWVYRDLSVYDVVVTRTGAVYEVAFTLKDATLDGGGPFYEIDAETGTILNRIYYQ